MIRAVPVTREIANAFVSRYHRHHAPSAGNMTFAIGALQDDDNLVGVVTCAPPVNRDLDDGLSLEVSRLVVVDCKNACSFLYSRAARAAKELGYRVIYTYILESETGDSLRASGWKFDQRTKFASWNNKTRARIDKGPTEDKARYSKTLARKERFDFRKRMRLELEMLSDAPETAGTLPLGL